jgi:hypothetical protein
LALAPRLSRLAATTSGIEDPSRHVSDQDVVARPGARPEGRQGERTVRRRDDAAAHPSELAALVVGDKISGPDRRRGPQLAQVPMDGPAVVLA